MLREVLDCFLVKRICERRRIYAERKICSEENFDSEQVFQ